MNRNPFTILTSVIAVLIGAACAFSGCQNHTGFGVSFIRLTQKEVRSLEKLRQPDYHPRPKITCSSDVTVIPLSHFDNYFLTLSIEGKKYRFLVDTGVPFCVVDPLVAIRHHVPISTINDGVWETSSGDTACHYGFIPKCELGNIVIRDMPVAVPHTSVGFNLFWNRMGTVDGAIGNKFFAGFVVEFDFRKKSLTLFKPAAFANKRETTNFIDVLPFTFSASGHLTVQGLRVNGQGPFSADLDTGGDTVVSLPGSVAKQCGVALDAAEDVYSWGGRVSGAAGIAKEIRLGNTVMRDVAVGSVPEEPENGITVGDVIFEEYKITIDYPGKKIYIESY